MQTIEISHKFDICQQYGALRFISFLWTSFSAIVIDQKESCRWVLRKKIAIFAKKMPIFLLKIFSKISEIIVRCVSIEILEIFSKIIDKNRFVNGITFVLHMAAKDRH